MLPSCLPSASLVMATVQSTPIMCSLSISRHNLEVPWFARDLSFKEHYPEITVAKVSSKREKFLPPYFPKDPRSWSRDEVCLWVTWTLFSHNLPCPSVDRFLMNGKAVCLMSVNMFTARVPLGGKMLYRDFQIRLAEAINSQRKLK